MIHLLDLPTLPPIASVPITLKTVFLMLKYMMKKNSDFCNWYENYKKNDVNKAKIWKKTLNAKFYSKIYFFSNQNPKEIFENYQIEDYSYCMFQFLNNKLETQIYYKKNSDFFLLGPIENKLSEGLCTCLNKDGQIYTYIILDHKKHNELKRLFPTTCEKNSLSDQEIFDHLLYVLSNIDKNQKKIAENEYNMNQSDQQDLVKNGIDLNILQASIFKIFFSNEEQKKTHDFLFSNGEIDFENLYDDVQKVHLLWFLYKPLCKTLQEELLTELKEFSKQTIIIKKQITKRFILHILFGYESELLIFFNQSNVNEFIKFLIDKTNDDDFAKRIGTYGKLTPVTRAILRALRIFYNAKQKHEISPEAINEAKNLCPNVLLNLSATGLFSGFSLILTEKKIPRSFERNVIYIMQSKLDSYKIFRYFNGHIEEQIFQCQSKHTNEILKYCCNQLKILSKLQLVFREGLSYFPFKNGNGESIALIEKILLQLKLERLSLDLSDAKLSHELFEFGAVFTGIKLQGCKLKFAFLPGVVLTAINLYTINNLLVTGAVINNGYFKNISFNYCTFDWSHSNKTNFINVNFKEVKCIDAQVSSAIFDNTKLEYVEARRTNFENCKFNNSTLSSVDFSGGYEVYVLNEGKPEDVNRAVLNFVFVVNFYENKKKIRISYLNPERAISDCDFVRIPKKIAPFLKILKSNFNKKITFKDNRKLIETIMRFCEIKSYYNPPTNLRSIDFCKSTRLEQVNLAFSNLYLVKWPEPDKCSNIKTDPQSMVSLFKKNTNDFDFTNENISNVSFFKKHMSLDTKKEFKKTLYYIPHGTPGRLSSKETELERGLNLGKISGCCNIL